MRFTRFEWFRVLGEVLEIAACFGLVSSAAITLLVGQWLLTGLLMIAAFGVLLRFKRGRLKP